jgi:hypothetical protein
MTPRPNSPSHAPKRLDDIVWSKVSRIRVHVNVLVDQIKPRAKQRAARLYVNVGGKEGRRLAAQRAFSKRDGRERD